jgi:hypothetical protein
MLQPSPVVPDRLPSACSFLGGFSMSAERAFHRVRACRGITIPTGPDKWERGEWSIEADVPLGMTADEALRELENIVLARVSAVQQLAAPASPRPTSQPSNPGPGETPELDPTYLDGLGWKSFVSGGGEWIVRDALGAKALSDELDRKGGSLTIGNHQYKVTVGRDREFINRFPLAKDSRK